MFPKQYPWGEVGLTCLWMSQRRESEEDKQGYAKERKGSGIHKGKKGILERYRKKMEHGLVGSELRG